MLLDHGAQLHLQADKDGLNDLAAARSNVLPPAEAFSHPYYDAAHVEQIIAILDKASKPH